MTAVIGLLVLFVHAGPASADQALINEALTGRADVVGTVVRLSAGQASAVALHRAGQLARSRGAAIILHPPGGNADDPTRVRPLRLGLSDAGWDTLAVQLPARLVSESPLQWLARNEQLIPLLIAASQWLEQRGQSNQVLLGIGSSGLAALSFVAGPNAARIQALVLISTVIERDSEAGNQLLTLQKPLLDVAAERDRADVLRSAAVKRQLAGHNAAFSQRRIADAGPGFAGMELELVSTVRAWLATHADDRRLRQPTGE